MSIILPSSCFAPILQFALITDAENYTIETKEHFVKQSYRSRFQIYGANGMLNLVVPVKKRKNHSPIEQIEVSYDESWQQLHWRSIESAYRASPFFEFYEEEIKPLVFLKEINLIKRNAEIERAILRIIEISSSVIFSKNYSEQDPDWRSLINPKNKVEMESVSIPNYMQVFEDKHGFIPNLSILDLLFNLGPESKLYLKLLNQSIKDAKKN
tara:strand:- start:1103 stop:1738 length:636 start_codon:yes stop_codon:yes gene_type:complete